MLFNMICSIIYLFYIGSDNRDAKKKDISLTKKISDSEIENMEYRPSPNLDEGMH